MSVCGTMHKIIYELQVKLTLDFTLRALKQLQARQTERYTELETTNILWGSEAMSLHF